MGMSEALQPPLLVRRRRPAVLRTESLISYFFLLPWIFGFIFFIVGPMIASLYLSLTTYDIVNLPRFIGLANFDTAFFHDDLFWSSLRRTFTYAVVVAPCSVAGALLVAMLVNQGLRATKLYRTFFFLPHLTPVVASVYAWTWLLDPRFGLVNEALYRAARIQGPGWFSVQAWALPSVMLIALWATIGGNMMLIFLAGLQGVPQDFYEVASLDGANALDRFRHITLPMISPALFFNTVLAVIGSLQTFTTAFVATQGGPAYATFFYALNIFNSAFQYTKMGYASALAWIFFVILVGFTYIQFRASTRWVYYAGDQKG